MTKFGIGQPVRRVEDQRFITGRGKFVGDVSLPHMAHGALVLSPHAHADIMRIDTSKARAAPGVLCVLTGADAVADKLGGVPPHFLPVAWGGPPAYSMSRPVLISGRVRCIGERVAFVVAETEAQAQAAAELVEIDYGALPAVIDLEAAAKPGADKIWADCPGGNIGTTIAFGDKAATDAGFAKAAHTASLRIENNRVAASPLEPRAAVGEYNSFDESFTLHTTSQDPHGARNLLAQAIFQIPETRVRVISPDVGGGFGVKSNLYPDDALVCWASKKCGRPVKWTATRAHSLLTDYQAREQVAHAEIAIDAQGKILGLRSHNFQALGAYWAAAITAPLFFSLMFTSSVYDIQALDLSTSAVYTNTTPTSVYRGAGRPEAIYVIERLIDRVAEVSGLDRVEIRRRNFIPSSAMPYHTPTHQNYDSGEFERLMDRAMELGDWNGFAARRTESQKRGLLRGRAVTPYLELGGVFNDRMEIRFDPSGAATIVAGTHSHGQGHATAFAQLVSEWLGIPFESIRYIQGDTEQVPFGRGTFAARSSMVGGGALRAAADAIIAKGRLMAGALLEASADDIEFAAGLYKVKGTDKAIPLTAVAKAFYAPAGPVLKFGLGLDAAGTYSGVPGGAPNYPNGCQVWEVEVDPLTGEVMIARVAAVDDLGMIINPLICEGQIHGAITQGLGQALLEKVNFDSAGQLLSGSFMDYAMPRAADLPAIASELVEIPCKTNPLGVKGIGESGTIGAPPSIVNAVLDALRPLGVRDLHMPLTPSRVWGAIQAARSG